MPPFKHGLGSHSLMSKNKYIEDLTRVLISIYEIYDTRLWLFIRFTARAFRKLVSIYVFSYFSFGFEGMMWDLIVSVPDQCLSFYFHMQLNNSDVSDKYQNVIKVQIIKTVVGDIKIKA